MNELSFYWLILIAAVAFLYASVGHGGASGYLALMAIMGISPDFAKPSALVMNIIVSGIAFLFFVRSGYFRSGIFIPLAIGSVPLAFIGTMIPVHDAIYKIILGICLLIAVSRILLTQSETIRKDPPHISVLILIGAVTGILSGMIGIGGGIIISPLLILAGWASIKESAGIASLFIFVNSISGVSGLMMNGYSPEPQLALMTTFATAGAIAGALSGSRLMRSSVIRAVLGIVLGIAGLKLILT